MGGGDERPDDSHEDEDEYEDREPSEYQVDVDPVVGETEGTTQDGDSRLSDFGGGTEAEPVGTDESDNPLRSESKSGSGSESTTGSDTGTESESGSGSDTGSGGGESVDGEGEGGDGSDTDTGGVDGNRTLSEYGTVNDTVDRVQGYAEEGGEGGEGGGGSGESAGSDDSGGLSATRSFMALTGIASGIATKPVAGDTAVDVSEDTVETLYEEAREEV